MASEGQRALGTALALGVALFTLAALTWPMLRFASGPESEVLSQLRYAEKYGFELTLPGLPGPVVKARQAHFDRVSVVMDTDNEAVAHATLDFDGVMGATEISSLGTERITFLLKDGDLSPREGLAPQLSRVLLRLEQRRRALEAADAKALIALSDGHLSAETLQAQVPFAELIALRDRKWRVRAWRLRLDRDEVQVVEDFHVSGAHADRPMDERRSRPLTLIWRDGEFFFSGELM